MSTAKFKIILMVLVTFFLEDTLCADATDISRLRAKILENYDNFTRPVQNHLNVTEVNMNFIHVGFEIDEQMNSIALNLISVLSWEDQHAKWDPLEYGNLSVIMFGPTELWRPEISVINNFGESEIDYFGNTLIEAFQDSEIWWYPPTKFMVPCVFDFRLWPYDKQTCKVLISSWTHHGAELNLLIRSNRTELYIDPEWEEFRPENIEWKLLGSKVERFSKLVYCCPELPEVPVVEIIITVNIERRSNAHTVAINAVGLGIAIAVLVSFWLDPFAQERLPLTLLILLLNSIYLQYLHRVIPNNGSNIPLSICFFRDSLIMVTFALAWTVFIQYIAKTKCSSPVPLPDVVQSFLNSFAATVLCLNPRPQSKGQTQRKLEESTDDGDVSELVGGDENNIIQQDWEWLARFLDRVAFFAYLISYGVFIIAFL